ncbi:MAG TPA: hypothetical protein VK543_19600 [Puia sp.]|nr:hypothetical protein [Puia sp.]
MPVKEISKIYDTVLCSPGMTDSLKIDMRITRKNVLLISRLIENGLVNNEHQKDEIFAQLPKETTDELLIVRDDILKKAGLNEFYEKLKSL